MNFFASRQNRITFIVAAIIVVALVIGAVGYSVYTLKKGSSAELVDSNVTVNVNKTSDNANNETNENVNSNETSNTSENTNTVTSPTVVNFTDNVQELKQSPTLEGGCEIAALACDLRALGFEADLADLADNYLVYSEDGSFDTGYSGDPYTVGFGYPACIVSTANAYLADQGTEGAKYAAHELKGVSFDDIMAQVENGWPVIVWTTMYMAEPQHTGIFSGDYEWYENEHCVVVYGETEDGKLKVSDPINGLVERDKDAFVSIYEDCGSMGIIINDQKTTD